MDTEFSKVEQIRRCFTPLIGSRITHCETAEFFADDKWFEWSQLFIRLVTDSRRCVGISWSQSDDLWITNSDSMPEIAAVYKNRCAPCCIPEVSDCIGRVIKSVYLGEDEMQIGDYVFQIWSRLIIELDRGCLEVHNGIDCNAYRMHSEMPDCKKLNCT